MIYLGYFNNFDDAKEARLKAEKSYKEFSPKRKYYYNKNYFDNIDTEEKAYWLGYIWADGNVDDDGLHLTSIDYNHLEKFRNDINGDMDIKKYKQNKKSFSPNNTCNRINLYGKDFSKKLIDNYYIVPKRVDDGELIVSKVPKIYQKDFIRGLIDGDGCIMTKQINAVGCSLVIIGQYYILEYCNDFINSILKTNDKRKYIKRHKNRDGNIFSLRLTGNRQVFYILDKIYYNSKIYLDRKYELYQMIVDYYKKFSNIDINNLQGSGSHVKKKYILEIRKYFDLRKEILQDEGVLSLRS